MKSGLSIRNAQLKDYDALCALFARSNEEHRAMAPGQYRTVKAVIPRSKYRLAILARDLFGVQPVSLQIAEGAGTIIGAVVIMSEPRSALSWSAFDKQAYIDHVVVAPHFRRYGVGTDLVEAGEQWAKHTGHQYIWAKIASANAPSRRMFEKSGYALDNVHVGKNLVLAA